MACPNPTPYRVFEITHTDDTLNVARTEEPQGAGAALARPPPEVAGRCLRRPVEAIDRLYGLPLDEFTAERDELAARLRKEGDRDAAADVKRLRKPSVAAWALNQVQRNDPKQVQALIEAGKRLRDAQELLSGGGRKPLDQAADDERRLVTELARHAERELVVAGRSVSGAVHERLRDTLRAVATDDEAREALSAGRLLRDHTPPASGRCWARSPRPRGGETAPLDVVRASSRSGSRRPGPSRTSWSGRPPRRGARCATRGARRPAAAALERAEAAEDQARRRAGEAADRTAELEEALAELE